MANDSLSLHTVRRGAGRPLVLVHGLGGNWQSWEPILDALAAHREVIAFDLPGHGKSIAGADSGTFIRLLRALRPVLPAVASSKVGRALLLSQLSARPWALDPGQVATELQNYATTPTFDALVRDLSAGPEQRGPAGPGAGPIAIGWGRSDRLCLPRQAARAMAAFPSASLHWFDGSGHFPSWDRPAQTTRFILDHTGLTP